MPAYVTVSVHNLPPETGKEDIEDHFTKVAPDCKPLIGPLVTYIQQREEVEDGQEEEGASRTEHSPERVVTTVTFEARDVKTCEELRERLHGSDFYAQHTRFGCFQIAVQREFLGLTPINQDHDPQFDFFFVHGLGGHAFSSWAEQPNSSSDMVMWPRDLLPTFLLNKDFNGRYSTLGYRANPRLADGFLKLPFWKTPAPHQPGTTITSAAKNLLSILRENKTLLALMFGITEVAIPLTYSKQNRRPIYFVCHSLGGLVVCKALILALWEGKGNKVKPHHKHLFMKDGRCVVKGIVFFGTPFQGSKVADFVTYSEGLVDFLEADKELLKSLKMNNDELNEITGRFKQVRQVHDIKILIYYESKPLLIKNLLGFKVTSAESAKGSFGPGFPPHALDADHRTMIKFSNERDLRYGQVSQDILNLVQETLTRRPSEGALSQSTPPASPMRRRTSTSSLKSSEIDAEKELHNKQASKGRAKGAVRVLKTRFRGIFKLKRSPPESERLPPTQIDTPQIARQSVASDPGFAQTMIERSRSRHSGGDSNIPEGLIESLFPLRDFDTVFVIDDSASMKKSATKGRNFMTRWEILIRSIEHFGGLAAQIDDDGIDLHFINNRHKDRENIRSGKTLLEIVTGIDWFPDATYLDDILQFILDEYMQKYRFYRKGSELDHKTRSLKPLNVIVISDGKCKDHEKVEATLVRTARALRGLSAPPTQVGVQFVQVGDDEIAAQWFRTLDDKLRPMYGVRDIVDTRTFSNGDDFGEEALQQKLRQILLGAISRAVDAEEDVDSARRTV